MGGAAEKENLALSNKASFCRARPMFSLRVSERRSGGTLSDRPQHAIRHDPTVVVLMSHGESGHGAYHGSVGHVQRLKVPQRYGPDKFYNAANHLHVISRGHSKKKGDVFDDMIVWVTRHNLMAFYGRSPCVREEVHGDGHVFI